MKLVRAYLDNCTIGKLYHEEHCGYTIEKPWLSNKPFESCIPHGIYKLKRYSSKRFPNSFYLSNPNLGVSLSGDTPRTGILIHVGNFVEDVVGCIAVGTSLNPIRWGVSESRIMMKALNELITTDDWEIEII